MLIRTYFGLKPKCFPPRVRILWPRRKCSQSSTSSTSHFNHAKAARDSTKASVVYVNPTVFITYKGKSKMYPKILWMLFLPGWDPRLLSKKLQCAGENLGKLKMPLHFTASLSSVHLSVMRAWLKWKNDSAYSEPPACSQLSDTTSRTLAARSCESLDTPMVFSSMNLIILFATSTSFTRAHLEFGRKWY